MGTLLPNSKQLIMATRLGAETYLITDKCRMKTCYSL